MFIITENFQALSYVFFKEWCLQNCLLKPLRDVNFRPEVIFFKPSGRYKLQIESHLLWKFDWNRERSWVLYPLILCLQYICIVNNNFYFSCSRESVKSYVICIYRELLVRLKQETVCPVNLPRAKIIYDYLHKK